MTKSKTGVVVCGCGHWGKNLVRNFAELGALAGVSDPNSELAEKFAKEFSVPALTWDEVLSSSADAVAIAAPAELHATLGVAAMKAGKHVYVEKPLALSRQDGELLIATAKQTGRQLMVGHLLQYHPAFIALLEMVRSGDLGKVQYVYSNRLSLGKIRREENVLWSFAPHDISMILALVGEEPDVVTSTFAPMLHEKISDSVQVQLKFPSGVRGHIFASWLHPFKEQKLVVIGSEGMAVFDDRAGWNEKLTRYRHTINWGGAVPTPKAADAEPVPLPEAEPLKLECQHFIDCVATNSRPRTDGAEALRVLNVLLAADPDAAKEKSGDRFPGVKIHESAYVDEPVSIGEGTRIWHFSHLLGNVQVGRSCSIGQNVVIGPNVKVGNNCKIQNNVSLYDGVEIEDGVFCGPSCVFTNVNNPRSEVERKDEFRKTLVKRGASIGANATIVCGNSLGEYSFVAAGATVTKDVPAYALMAGVPAKRIGWMSKAGGRLGADLICPIDGTQYREKSSDELVAVTE
ncbi:MAG: Gfo/Idh/MocA family oxidoreductase [Parvibaculaceae bacterium]|nr:oxidoreductase [Rhodobiaceae bacterium]MDF1625704.1 Gfo/Idh/MocA family oxidoreductase [Parvibaculaceae bacterium]|tara:strand:- start:296 stop:1846 length:1551 start_codon:yes stop_codon:yes gene_type:complete